MLPGFCKAGWLGGLVVFPLSWLWLGCAAVSPPGRMDEVAAPDAWSATRQGQAGVDRRWLSKMGGADLRKLVDEAVAQNQDLKAAAARVQEAAAEARIAGAGRLPVLGLDANGRRSNESFIGLPVGGSGAPIRSEYGVALNAAWELDVWGRVRAGQEAAIADVQARQLEFEAAQASLAAQVAKAWLALGEANEQLALAETGLLARRALADAVKQRFDRAIVDEGGSAAQVRLTAAEAANGEGILAQRKQERERVLRQLEILLGRYPAGSVAGGARLPNFPGPTPAGLPSELLMRRPDVMAAERTLAASGRRVKEARLARFPSLKLTGSGGSTTAELGNLIQSSFGTWSLGGSLSQPIFEGGRLMAAEDRSSAREREEMAKLQKVVLDAFGEVEQALTAESFWAQREQASKRAMDLATEAAQRADEEFSAGTGDVLTLIEATQQQIDTSSQWVGIRRMRLDNRVDLHLALGGGFIVEKS